MIENQFVILNTAGHLRHSGPSIGEKKSLDPMSTGLMGIVDAFFLIFTSLQLTSKPEPMCHL